MSQGSSAWTLAVALIFGLSLSAGANQPDYAKSEACGVPSKLISDVLGAKAFAVIDSDRDFPIDDTSLLDFQCPVVSVDNDLISIVARFQSADYTELSHNTISKTKGHYEYAGGGGVVRGNVAVWTCGQVDLGVEAHDPSDASPADIKALLNAVADRAGCWPNK